ncbi:hypothetical protein E4K67_07575 [Desulfosporosinus fructosivorans]|uniref:DUF7479 domain-containing protein n=1 Tax=Desulfosporosinus fructosivorans TaxID=2018669 RepID=A0A4Z0R8Y5_9FIRM|nr:CLJU_RS11820 family redox protein [Desulfosporosinus fructosivorans]TGE39290.1 hypothetical protein E4K67_07575 [Desulfosporosinus fructosivorans]
MQDGDQKLVVCYKCNVALELRKSEVSYQGYKFVADLHRCPSCGQAYISEELVKGKMKQVEKELEEK